VTPLLEFRNFGIPLKHHWTTVVEQRRVRHRLFHPHRGRALEHLHQPTPRGALLLLGSRPQRREAQRSQALHLDLPQRRAPSRPSRASGRSPSTTSSTSLRRTSLTASPSAPSVENSRTPPTARSPSMCSTSAPAKRG
jgi:hypothetical protein